MHNQGKKFLKRPKNLRDLMNVISVHSNHRHVSATHVDIFKVKSTEYNYGYSVFDTLYL